MLTETQLATLKAVIIADPTAGPIRASGDSYSLMAWCNAPSTTLAWRSAVQPQESDEAATYTAYDSLVAGKRDSWAIFLKFPRDFKKAKVRNWITDIWGNATAGSIAESILQAGMVKATTAEAVFGGTSKTTGTVTAINRTWEGQIGMDDAARLVS